MKKLINALFRKKQLKSEAIRKQILEEIRKSRSEIFKKRILALRSFDQEKLFTPSLYLNEQVL